MNREDAARVWPATQTGESQELKTENLDGRREVRSEGCPATPNGFAVAREVRKCFWSS